jgi:hypothetical protein
MAQPRLLKLGAKGRDVRAVQRALRKSGFRPKTDRTTDTFDQRMKDQVVAFQQARGLTPADGEVGRDTYAALKPSIDRFGRLLIQQAANAAQQAKTTRKKIVAAAHLCFQNRALIHYTQNGIPPAPRRMDGVRRMLRPPAFPEFEDCSSFSTWCYFAAGAPDPNGLSYNGEGWTGTQHPRGTETVALRPGDLVFYGPNRNSINHVTVYVGNGQVISHGGETGPRLFRLDYDRGSLGGRQFAKSYLP